MAFFIRSYHISFSPNRLGEDVLLKAARLGYTQTQKETGEDL